MNEARIASWLSVQLDAMEATFTPIYGALQTMRNDMAKAHPGFKAVAASISKKEGVSSKRAGAILAASSRRASPAAKRANPRLRRV